MVLGVLSAACAGETVASSGDRSGDPSADAIQSAIDSDDVATQASEVGENGEDSATATATVDPLDPTAVPEPTATPAPTPTPEGENPYTVVTLMGETGVMGPLDGPAVAGVAAQIEILNEDGGLLDQPIELIRIDTNSRVSLAQRLSERLLRDPPDLLIVSCDVDFSRPILEFADANDLLTISPCADDIGYSTGAWGSRNFTFGAPPEPRGALAAQAAFQRYGATAMVLRDVTSPEARRFCNGFERTFRELGGSVSYRDEFTYDSLEPLLGRLAERGSDTASIVLCSHVPGNGSATPNIVEQLRLGGFAAPIVSGSTVDQGNWFGEAPLLNELTYVSWSSIFGNDPNADINALVDRAASDSETPAAGSTTALGADSVAAWARAVEAVRSVDSDSVAAALGSFSREPFLTGEISFTAGSRMDVSRTYRVMRVTGDDVGIPELATVEG